MLKFKKLLVGFFVTALISSCSVVDQFVDDNTHTGDTQIEKELGSLKPEDIKAGKTVYVASSRLNLRSEPEAKPDNIVGVLDINDKLEIVNPNLKGEHQFVEVRVLESRSGLTATGTYYTSARHLNDKPAMINNKPVVANKYFIVTNIATEKVRVYQRCEPTESCVNKLIFEQDVVNGEDDNGTRTDLGHFRISSWEKFYETPGKYPAWYKPGYPAVPSPGASMKAWFRDDYMPGGKGEMRGAFGWYTMKIAPNHNGQWMHGTAGWGKDKKKYIMFKESTMGAITNLFTSIRSHGCTRIDNESIAYLRSLLPVNTTYVKIYAKEVYRDKSRSSYSQQMIQWPYIMTKNGWGKTDLHQLADRDLVLAAGTPNTEWIEEGIFEVDQYPDAVALDRSYRRAKGGDLYKLGEEAFRGVFVVDEGTVVGYKHPSALYVGGYPDKGLPNVMISTDSNYSLPGSSRGSRWNNGNDSGSSNDPWGNSGG